MNVQTTTNRKKRRLEEETEQKSFFLWLAYFKKIRSLTYAIPNGGSRSKKEIISKGKKIFISPEGRRLKDQGVTPGILDIIIFIPSKGYHALIIEMKSKKGKLTPEQEQFIEKVTPLGYCCKVARSWIEAKTYVEEYLDKTWFT